jgi:hypothetical protein
MTDPDRLRQHAEQLFALALHAREKGDAQLAEQLTARALQYLDEANGTLEDEEPNGTVEGQLPPTEPQPIAQVQQQQQGQQTEDDGEKD